MDRVGVGRRFVAYFIDTWVIGIPFLCMILFVAIAFEGEPDVSDALAGLLYLGYILTLFAYFTLMEAFSGATLGKKLLNISVVKANGEPMSLQAAAIRNVFRIIDNGFFWGLIGAIAIWASQDKQRIGDMVAKTLVVYDRPAQSLSEPPYPTAPEQRF